MQEAILQIHNLTKQFGESFAIKGINLQIHPGEIFGIIGRSGAGKSTLMRCLTLLERPSEGHILLNGCDLTALSDKKLRSVRRKMGMIFQHFNLFSSRSAIENVAYPLEIEGVSKELRIKRARELIELVGLTGKEDYFPAQLSGGEKQRVAIARALVRDPNILFCDEATSALDPSTTQSILALLAQLNQNLSLTIVLITHEMEVIKQICTHVAVLEEGRVVEHGKTAALFSAPQHPITKRFLQHLTHTIPEHLLPKSRDQELLRLFFRGRSASEPIMTRLIRGFDVDVNILLGGIDILKFETVGNLVIALSGSEDERSKACQFLKANGVLLERVS